MNTTIIKLPASLKEDLNWSSQRQEAKKVCEMGGKLLWELDLGFQTFIFSPVDTTSFFSLTIAMEEFVKTAWGPFESQGVILYRGSVDFSERFPKELWQSRFEEWLEEMVSEAPEWHELKLSKSSEVRDHYYRLFSCNLFAQYLHRLVSFLPEGAIPYVLFDPSEEMGSAAREQLLSKQRFEHLYLGLSPSEEEPQVALCFPTDAYCDRSILEVLEELMKKMREKEVCFRIIPEEKLNEEWDGINEIVVHPPAVSAWGKRKLQGFCAAGGRVITSSGKVGVACELTWDEFK